MQQTLANRLVLPSSSDNPREQTRIREFPKRLLNTLSSFLQLPATIYTYIFFKYILYIYIYQYYHVMSDDDFTITYHQKQE